MGYYLFSKPTLNCVFLKPVSLHISQGDIELLRDIMSDYISQIALSCVSNDCQRD